MSRVITRQRWLLKAHGQHIVVVRGQRERVEHPLMKALLWALYLPLYPEHMTIEVSVGDRYKPDVVAFAPNNPRFRVNEPVFWGEAGAVARDKIAALVKRYPDTHFAMAKWDTRNKPYEDLIRAQLTGVRRSAPFDLLIFPAHSANFIDDDGNITVSFADVQLTRLG